MTHWLVDHGRNEFPRWCQAFPEARQVPAADMGVVTAPGDTVWVTSDTPAWSALIAELSRHEVLAVVLSLAPNEREALQALRAGARGYLHALAPAPLLRQAALVTANQGIWVPSDLMRRVLGATYRALGGEPSLPSDELAGLTKRERDVALAVASGQSNKEVARRFGITERTVKAHLGAVFRKLAVRDRMQLVLCLSRRTEVS